MHNSDYLRGAFVSLPQSSHKRHMLISLAILWPPPFTHTHTHTQIYVCVFVWKVVYIYIYIYIYTILDVLYQCYIRWAVFDSWLMFPNAKHTGWFSIYHQVWSEPSSVSVQRLATGWTVRGWNSGGGEIFRACPHRTWGPPSLLYNMYRVFPGGKEWPKRDTDPSPSPSAVVKKE